MQKFKSEKLNNSLFTCFAEWAKAEKNDLEKILRKKGMMSKNIEVRAMFTTP